MQILQTFAGLFSNFGNLTWQMVVMWVIGGLLIYLAIVKKMEPSLLLPMLRCDSCQPAAVGCHHPGGHRGADLGAV